jgi:hypothetical protein
MTIDDLVRQTIAERTVEELAVGWLRYEAIRKLFPAEFMTLHHRNLKGERFDDMVDELCKTPN